MNERVLIALLLLIGITLWSWMLGVNILGYALRRNFLVVEVVDGDTFRLEDGRVVRLIGIDAPERGKYFHERSRDALRSLVLGKRVRLERDVSDLDSLGRLLRYAFIDGVFINLEQVRWGNAVVRIISPDTKHAGKLIEAEEMARGQGIGLWEGTRSPWAGCVEIVEFHWNAAGDDRQNLNDEYVIFRNVCDFVIDLSGWKVVDAAWHVYVFGKLRLLPGSRVRLSSGTGIDEQGQVYWGSGLPIWNNDGDSLFLRDGEDKIVLVKSYIGFE
jgi:micrococcal nuclease